MGDRNGPEHAAGATIIGGCCGIGPEHIQAISQAYPHQVSDKLF